MLKQEWPAPRTAKFRQAGFVYLHVALLYESAVYAMLQVDPSLLPLRFGVPWLWLGLGALIAGFVFIGLYRWQNVWFARIIWILHSLRLPSLIASAFFDPSVLAPQVFYMTAILAVIINLWMLARAGWDI